MDGRLILSPLSLVRSLPRSQCGRDDFAVDRVEPLCFVGRPVISLLFCSASYFNILAVAISYKHRSGLKLTEFSLCLGLPRFAARGALRGCHVRWCEFAFELLGEVGG